MVYLYLLVSRDSRFGKGKCIPWGHTASQNWGINEMPPTRQFPLHLGTRAYYTPGCQFVNDCGYNPCHGLARYSPQTERFSLLGTRKRDQHQVHCLLQVTTFAATIPGRLQMREVSFPLMG